MSVLSASKADVYLTVRSVTLRIRRVATGGYRADPQPGVLFMHRGSIQIPQIRRKKLVRYEITHNGRYLWSEPTWAKARAAARRLATKISEQRSAPDGK